MNTNYIDIRERIPSSPLWWDEHAVPRYVEFHPRHCANIYADEAALVLITCQNCGREFAVAFTIGRLDLYNNVAPLEEQIVGRTIHYGDPPNIDCCPSGPTMNSEPRRVLQFWRRGAMGTVNAELDALGRPKVVQDLDKIVASMEWKRDPSLDVEIEPDWVKT